VSDTTAHNPPVIGFLGLGSIGAPMAERILQAGYRLIVHDIRPEAMAPFQGRAELAQSPADVAHRTDIVFCCLATNSSFKDAVYGQTGIVAGHRARLYVHLGTNGSEIVQQLAEQLGRRNIATLDAPMTGGRRRAADGTLTVMASGPQAAFDAAEPVIRSYAGKIVYLSDQVGAAQVMKAVNNMMSLTNLAAACEAMLVGVKAGLDPQAMLEVLNSGSGQNSATADKVPRHVLPRTFDFGGSLAIVMKDSQTFLDEAAARGIATPISDAVRHCYETALAAGSELDDITTVVRHMERAIGIELRAVADEA
jgi:3-hydroxyisobutyrate dehydrogenase-like beta-hydroxyacid dehydrogenase